MTDVLDDLGAAIADGRVWLALGVAGIGVVLLVLLGVLIARRVGLLPSPADGDAADTFSVGLSVGLVAFSAGWAAVASGGRSVFVPVAVLLLAAIVAGSGRPTIRFRLDRRSLRGGAAVAVFLVAIGLLYATTIAPSPRDGLQPIEFFDVGYYSVLGADLADTGVETIYSPAGFDALAGLPEQTWYHWGELWLAASAIDLAGVSALHARHLVVLPILLLAAATLVGTLVRRLVSPTSTELYVHGAAAMLFLAPIPLSNELHFAGWARGLVFGITQYGLAVTVVLLGLYLTLVGRDGAARPGPLVVGAAAAALIASHVGLALTVAAAVVGVLVISMVRSASWRSPATRTDPMAALYGSRAVIVIIGACVASVVWGMATGHGLGALDAIAGVTPFDSSWLVAVLLTTAGAGILLAAPIAAGLGRGTVRGFDRVTVGATLAVGAGALGWGIRVADVNAFHLFFGPIAAILTPVAVVAALRALDRARRVGRRGVATVVLMALVVQTWVSAAIVGVQLHRFGPGGDPGMSVEALAAIRELPDDAKMAYACRPFEIVAPWDASLIALDARTGVRMVPMCFMADVQRDLLERPLEKGLVSPFFLHVPQLALYPDADVRPSPAAMTAFLNANGIEYIYADASHPNSLIPDAVSLFTIDGVTVARVPSA